MSASLPDVARAKREAAEQAATQVKSGMVVGLGTGSTARFAVEAIGRRLEQRELENIVGIPSSARTRDLALAAGIQLTSLNDHPVVDLTIDGADEVDPSGNLIKGGGGALLWEKMVAAASKRLLIVVDESKLVSRLGVSSALPVEVVKFGWKVHAAALLEMGAEPELRVTAGEPYVTDEGHYIIDCRFTEGIADPRTTHQAIVGRAGVVETGLFVDMAPEVIVGRGN
jgi:ribose 5-phosphate isomerase A